MSFDSILLPGISAKSAKYHTDFGSSCSNLIISVHCSKGSTSMIDEFISNLHYLSIHSDAYGWFTVRLSMCWLVLYLRYFVLIMMSYLSKTFIILSP